MRYKIIETPKKKYRISKKLHSVFFEYFGRVIYDGIWVGKDSEIPNIDGIRLDVIEGCREIGVGAMRWPGGCCADHYHWKNGIGKERYNRHHLLQDPGNPVWRNDFGTDEFLRFCELTGAEPILTANTATGTPEEFLDWYEYVNGPTNTKYGQMRAQNGHEEPYNVKYWGLGNTDENVWHVDFNNPISYAQRYMQFQTLFRAMRDKLYFIGLGLSTRHKLPGWVGQSLNHITQNQKQRGPDALSVHHYLGGAKQGGALCGDAIAYTDDGYYALLDLLERYQYDIDLHRVIIREHTSPKYPATKICFDEWGVWHPEATIENNQNQRQTVRDAIFAALTLHIFYRNSDVVEFAMETQLCNLLQSLFETDGAKCYKTPTFYVMKLFREHAGQYLLPLLPDDVDEDLDTVATISENGEQLTVSIVNRHLYDTKPISLAFAKSAWTVERADVVTADAVRAYNTFEEPERVRDHPFSVPDDMELSIPPHSVVRICLTK
ncbi:MAG: hypothetical protein E7590_09095 [Ruminococcaceae bacterium]|nr:hypothetical protein [Oscillospiraceae bacterium]